MIWRLNTVIGFDLCYIWSLLLHPHGLVHLLQYLNQLKVFHPEMIDFNLEENYITSPYFEEELMQPQLLLCVLVTLGETMAAWEEALPLNWAETLIGLFMRVWTGCASHALMHNHVSTCALYNSSGPAEQARQTRQPPDQYFRRILLLSVFLHVWLQHSSLACASLTVCDHIVEPCESTKSSSVCRASLPVSVSSSNRCAE